MTIVCIISTVQSYFRNVEIIVVNSYAMCCDMANLCRNAREVNQCSLHDKYSIYCTIHGTVPIRKEIAGNPIIPSAAPKSHSTKGTLSDCKSSEIDMLVLWKVKDGTESHFNSLLQKGKCGLYTICEQPGFV